jgi:DNA-binding MarR family transcriptional regulator
MEKINFKKDKIPFTQIANEVLNDKTLSFKAKGLYAYLYSKPDGWDFAIDRIALDTSEGRASVNSGLKELEKNGFLLRERQKTGRVVYLLKSQMTKISIGLEKPYDDNAKVAKCQSGKTVTVSNKEYKVIKSNSNKDSEQGSQEISINDYIEILKPLNPIGYTKWFSNKTQRSNVDLLKNQFTENQLRELLRFIEVNKDKDYFPSIATPLQLVDKLPQVEKFYKSKGYKKKPNVIT